MARKPSVASTTISPRHKDFTKRLQIQKIGAEVLADATLDAAALQDIVTLLWPLFQGAVKRNAVVRFRHGT